MKNSPELTRLALFRFDAGAAIGGGHAVRCLALAQALSTDGWQCRIVTTSESVQALSDFTIPGCKVITVPAASARTADSLSAVQPSGCDLLVVDHYGWSAIQEGACRGWARQILAIDDLCDRTHDCDLLLDASLNRNSTDYASLVEESCRLLLNPGYALLRPEFSTRRLALAAPSSASGSQRVFINFGLLDSANLTERALAAIESIAFTGSVDVVIGSGSPNLNRLRQRLANSTLHTTLHVEPANLVDLLDNADLAIGAAGGSAWERCCLGLPSLVVAAAENQSYNARTLAEYGACEWLMSNDAGKFVSRIAALLGDPDRLARMAAVARGITDGLGARRTAIAVAPEATRVGDLVNLRRANMADSELLLRWQRHRATRRYARNPQAPSPSEHRIWLNQKLQDPSCVFNIVECNGKPTGALRFDRVRDLESPDAFEISIYIDPEQTGKGIGQAALAAGRRLLPTKTFIARVLPDNNASHTLFRNADYRFHNDFYVSDPDTA